MAAGGAEFDLWYAHYDNDPSFKDFRPFGGWTKPFRKVTIDYECGKMCVCVWIALFIVFVRWLCYHIAWF